MPRLPHKPGALPVRGSDLKRYGFALLFCLFAILIERLLRGASAHPVFPVLPAFAAIICSAFLGGTSAGFFATSVLTLWSLVKPWAETGSAIEMIARTILLALAGALLSVGTASKGRLGRQTIHGDAWLGRLMEHTAEGIWIRSSKGVITWANARVGEMLGMRPEELIGKAETEFFAAEDLASERVRAENLIRMQMFQFDRRLKRSDGSEIWVLACCRMLAGKHAGSLAMMTDITERKHAEQALRRSEERFRSLFENIPEGVYQSTPEGRILAANPMLLRMLGLASEQEMNDVNIAPDLYVDPELRKRLVEHLESEGGFQNVEFELRRRDGRVITVLETARVVRDERGAVLYYEGTLADITAKKQLELQLRRAQKVEALGRLAGEMAHDFSNVLNIITRHSRRALDLLDDQHLARPSVAQTLQAAENAEALFGHVLSFNRGQTPEETDLNHAIEYARRALTWLLNSHAHNGEGELSLSFYPQPIPVRAGKGQIEQILLNAAANILNASLSAKLVLQTVVTDFNEEMCRIYGVKQTGSYAAVTLSNQPSDVPAVGIALNEVSDVTLFPITNPGDATATGFATAHDIVAQLGGSLAARQSVAGDSAIQNWYAAHIFLPLARK